MTKPPLAACQGGIIMRRTVTGRLFNSGLYRRFLIIASITLFGCNNGTDSKNSFQQSPPPCNPPYEYVLNPVWVGRTMLGPYGQLNLEYYISKSDCNGFSNYIKTDIIPYVNNMPLDQMDDSYTLSLASTTLSLMEAWLKAIDGNDMEGLMSIRDEFFVKYG
jgi:hypothetical protein